jgi:ankyrin repeat protein
MRALDGADVDAAEDVGNRPLHKAAESDQNRAACELRESGAAIIILEDSYNDNELGETLLMVAV